MKFSDKFFTGISFSLLLMTVMVAGCNNPAGDDHEEHADPFGLQLITNGEVVAEYFNGEITGNLTVTEGEETSLITVRFLDEEGDVIEAGHLEEENSLDWNIGNSDIAEIEQHEEDGKWSFHLTGKNAGDTRIQFLLMHGDHADFETPAVTQENAIEIHVEPAG